MHMRGAAFLGAWLALPGVAAGQGVPERPLTFGDGRVVLGGDVAVSAAPEDRGFFNYSDYEQTTVRQFRVGLSGLVRVTERVSVLGEIRSENFNHVAPFALYARIRPFTGRRFDVQIGRIPPVFGSFSRRTYGHDNPLIGVPIAYQYLTSLRADAVARDADELLRMRARGWLASYSIGNADPRHGVPLVNGFTWDTGIQASSGWKNVTLSGAVTNGTASNPRVADDNRGKQVAARVAVTPITGLVVGGSFARGEFLSRRVRRVLTYSMGRSYPQEALGVDVEYSRDRWVVRADAMMSKWAMPLDSGATPTWLRAAAVSVEGRYTFLPGWYGAARAEHLGFNRIRGGTRIDEWDAPLTRVELGAGYYLRRNLIARLSIQANTRDGGRVTSSRFAAGQLLYWF